MCRKTSCNKYSFLKDKAWDRELAATAIAEEDDKSPWDAAEYFLLLQIQMYLYTNTNANTNTEGKRERAATTIGEEHDKSPLGRGKVFSLTTRQEVPQCNIGAWDLSSLLFFGAFFGLLWLH